MLLADRMLELDSDPAVQRDCWCCIWATLTPPSAILLRHVQAHRTTGAEGASVDLSAPSPACRSSLGMPGFSQDFKHEWSVIPISSTGPSTCTPPSAIAASRSTSSTCRKGLVKLPLGILEPASGAYAHLDKAGIDYSADLARRFRVVESLKLEVW
jgi:hypothetical protein